MAGSCYDYRFLIAGADITNRDSSAVDKRIRTASNVRMKKDQPIAFRVDAPLKTALEKAARDDQRSLSSLIVKILTDWLREKGYLPK